MSTKSPFEGKLIFNKNVTSHELSVNIKCGHGMEINTMKQWVTKHKQCPYCLIESSPEDIIKIYHEDTINEKYQEYYKDKYEEMKKMSEKKVKCNHFIDNKIIISIFEYEMECKKNRRLKNLLCKKIDSGIDFISQNGIEDMIQIEMDAKNEEINILRLRVFEAQMDGVLNDNDVVNRKKICDLESKLKYHEDERYKYFSRLIELQEKYKKLEIENNFLKKQHLTIQNLQDLNDKINNQISIIDNLTSKNEILTKEIEHHDNIINKIEKKSEKNFNQLNTQYQELKKTTEILEKNIQSHNDKEKDFYEFDKKICNIFPIFNQNNKTIQLSRNLFLKEQQILGSLVWKKVEDDFYMRIKKFIDTFNHSNINEID